MKVKAQFAMVLNLDKCLGCHTCSIPCKNAWTTAPGAEYMWFNNVETKPGIGYPKKWENQQLHKGGWKVKQGKLHLTAGSKMRLASGIFANPNLPGLDEYYEPWNYDYQHLASAPESKHLPTARAVSSVTGEPMTPQWGPNWEDDLAGSCETGLDDVNFAGLDAKAYLQFKQVFMFHLPRLCEHCLNPACVASCPSGAAYKRDEDGIVLIDQTRCRSWRQCVSGCPYKKTYFNRRTHHSEKCLFCYPRLESGQPSLCAQSCVGRIRYQGIVLYDADAVHAAAAVPRDVDLYEAQLGTLLDPHDPAVIRQASKDGIPHTFIEAAKRSPVYKLAVQWRLALPLHPEFRTMPMVWYIPPASPLIQGGLEDEKALDNMRIPVRYLANLMTAGDEKPVRAALAKLLLLRRAMRDSRVHTGVCNDDELAAAGVSRADVEDMYHLLAVARYEDRFVIPTARRELACGESIESLKGHAGFPHAANAAPEADPTGFSRDGRPAPCTHCASGNGDKGGVK